MDLNYATIIETLADSLTSSPCLFYGDTTTSWQDYDRRAARVSQSFVDAGLTKDSKVGLLLYNSNEYMEATLAAYKNRSIPININYCYVGHELAYVLNDCEAEALVFHSSLGDRVVDIRELCPKLKLFISVNDNGALIDGAVDYEEIIAGTELAPRIDRSPSDKMMLYTGGTTGMPKGVEYELGGMLNNFVQLGPLYFGIKSPESLDDLVSGAKSRAEKNEYLVSLPASPLMHTAAIANSGMLVHVYGGAMAILTSSSFDPHEFWRIVEKRRVVHTVVVGDAFVRPILSALEEDKQDGVKHDISSLKTMMSSGVMLSQTSKQRLLEWGDLTIIDGVGATEGVMGIHMSSRANPPVGTAKFTALPTTEIFDENDVLIPRGSNKVGFIGMGGQLPEGYYKDPEKTARTFRLVDGKRWGFTGDMGAIDETGTLTFLGRGTGLINSGGEKVFPEEVEEVIKEHPAVKDCIVVGKPDERFGQVVAAVVSLHSSLDNLTEELKTHCRGRLANFKLPRDAKLVDEVQRSPHGKADYKWAKAFFPDD